MTSGGPVVSSEALRLRELVRTAEQPVIQLKQLIQADQRVKAGVETQLLVQSFVSVYAESATMLRRMVDCSIVWRPGAALIAATAIGGVLFVLSRSPLVGYITFPTVLAFVWLVLSYPSDFDFTRVAEESDRLQLLKIEMAVRIRERQAQLRQATDQLDQLNLLLQQQQLVDSRVLQRRILLSMDWRDMRGVEFELFLEMVFDELGYTVKTTKITGDQGVDLIVTYRDKRIAIQAKGYESNVSNSAVQEAHTGMAYYKCDAAAVITNSRFTRAAHDVAQRVRCQLINEDSLPQLIMGQIDLWSMCFPGTTPEKK